MTIGAVYHPPSQVRPYKRSQRCGLQPMEVKMKLITTFELAAKNKTELQALYKEVFNDLAQSSINTPERSNALASLENIEREIHLRL